MSCGFFPALDKARWFEAVIPQPGSDSYTILLLGNHRAEVMTRNCKTITPGALAAEALQMMQHYRINALPVVNSAGMLAGVLNMHDLLRAGVL